ncbi:MAG: ATPase [Tepidibacter sp.]|uniref:ATPase n=1 Tax=Tepidibacter sp. TaxID=2529387 RepID=UPI0025E4D9DB|nr:ATPase [Tepidibacter sp.]MCT4508196.1 ATPase [Tepidibacter sp.]
MELLKLIEEIEDLVEESSGIPFGNKVFVDKKQFLEIIKEIRLQLPDEIKQAEWINTERQRILAEAQQEADAIVENTKSYVQEQVEESEVLKEAQKQAEQIIQQAQNTSKEIRRGAKEYADKILGKVQVDLGNIMEVIASNREELK